MTPFYRRRKADSLKPSATNRRFCYSQVLTATVSLLGAGLVGGVIGRVILVGPDGQQQTRANISPRQNTIDDAMVQHLFAQESFGFTRQVVIPPMLFFVLRIISRTDPEPLNPAGPINDAATISIGTPCPDMYRTYTILEVDGQT
jgi:hypothetical protein